MVKTQLTDFRGRAPRKGRENGSVRRERRWLRNSSFLFLGSSASLGLCVGLVLFLIYHWLTVSSFFQITSIRIEGNHRLDKQQILALSGIDIHTNLLAMDRASVIKRIAAHQWVNQVEVDKNWPSDLVIKVSERLPVALLNSSFGLFFADKNGTVFAPAVPPDELDFPVITGLEGAFHTGENGISFSDIEGGAALKQALLFIKYAGGGNSALPRQNISEMYVDAKEGYTLYLADNPFPIFLGEEISKKRYYRLAKVLYWLYKKREFSNVNFIRMDYMNNKVLVGKNEA